MVIIRALDHVEHCYSNEDGRVIYNLLKPKLANYEKVKISFEGVDSVPSSFVNSAFIALLDEFDFMIIREHLGFVDSTRQINQMIKDRFNFEVHERNRKGNEASSN